MFDMSKDLIFAFEEEIGDKDLFSGRKNEIKLFIDWAQQVKKKLQLSIALLARRKKGKTSLVQRLYNVLYSMNDPMIIPVYYKVKEQEKSQIDIADELYNRVLTQYVAFVTRKPELVSVRLPYSKLKELLADSPAIVSDIEFMEMSLSENNADKSWDHAAFAAERISIIKNVRIIQILDEFQYLNEYVFNIIDGAKHKIKLCGTYHHVGASKIAPVIVTGSYISWLLRIISKMTGRYHRIFLKNLPFEEAVEAVYAYSKAFDAAVTEETAAYIAKITQGDVFYISSIFDSFYPDKNLTSFGCIDDIILYETRKHSDEYGTITSMWLEYLHSAIEKVNDKNAKKIILYLAKYHDQERTRDQINQDLNLNMTDFELEKKLDALIKADILRRGSNAFRYSGLGDRLFDIIFRRMYQEEINSLKTEETKTEIIKELKSLKGQVSFYKGLMTEYAVINRMLFAQINGKRLSDLVVKPLQGYELSGFGPLSKKRISLNQIKYIEVDIFIEAKVYNACDFIIEVKNHANPVTKEHVNKFIETKNKLLPVLKRKTGFIFYSHNPVPQELQDLLFQNEIMTMTAVTLEKAVSDITVI